MNITAALLTEHGKPLTLATLQPEPLQYGQVLVKILGTGICGAQLQEIDGHKMGGPLPHPLGHEACAEVVEVGPAVRNVKVGQRVCCHWRKGDGIESDFPRYSAAFNYHVEPITGGKVTTFSEYSVVSENRLTVVPDDAPIELVSLLGCGLSTALGTIESEANLKMGESVLIIGCGGLGLNLILAAKMRKASLIVGMDLTESKGLAAFTMGAHGYAWGEKEAGKNFDVVIDTTGNRDAMSYGLQRLAPSGRFFLVGQPAPNVSVPIDNARHLFDGEGCTIKATQGGMFRPSQDVPRYIRLWQSGQLDVTGIVTHRMPLPFINDAIAMVRKGDAGRVLITNP